MSSPESHPAILVLADGAYFKGYAAGMRGITTGEICFNTGMTGYQEIFTDPSYFGQILVNTNAHIGNYGTMPVDDESAGVKIAGLVVKNFSQHYSRQQGDASLHDYLTRNKIVAISGIDTRALVKHIRHDGAMNAIISSTELSVEALQAKLAEVPGMEGLELSSSVSTEQPYDVDSFVDVRFKVAVLDLGVKKNILKHLASRGCQLRVFPAKTPAAAIAAWSPDGFFMSNGPGDPGAMDYAVDTAKYFLAQQVPMFGICLGHQILARAMGVSTYKMHHGHRGANHPVINKRTGKSEITTQNHGFGVNPDELAASVDRIEITHVNLNDYTIEGIAVKGKPAFSVQYHPEASPGPHDSHYLFDDFIALMQERAS